MRKNVLGVVSEPTIIIDPSASMAQGKLEASSNLSDVDALDAIEAYIARLLSPRLYHR